MFMTENKQVNPSCLTGAQRAAFERLLAWWEGSISTCVLHGPVGAGKTHLCRQLEAVLAETAQVSFVTLDSALGTSEELLALAELYMRVLSHEWSAEDVAAPSTGVCGPYTWAARLRSELWSPNDCKRLVVVDGVDSLRSWRRMAEVLQVGTECRVLVVVHGGAEAVVEWSERLGWRGEDISRVSLSALSVEDARTLGAPPWVIAELGAPSLHEYLQSCVDTPLQSALLALLAEAHAPIEAAELAALVHAPVGSVESALLALRRGVRACGDQGSPPKQRDEELGCGPVEADAGTGRWFMRSSALGRELRAHHAAACEEAAARWARAAAQPTAKQRTYIRRFATAHATRLEFAELQSLIDVERYRLLDNPGDFVCDLQRVRDIAQARFLAGAQSPDTANATRLLVGSTLAQAATRDAARGEAADSGYRERVFEARVQALVDLGSAGSASVEQTSLAQMAEQRALRLVSQRGVEGVETLLRARRQRAHGLDSNELDSNGLDCGLHSELANALARLLDGHAQPWTGLSAQSALELYEAGIDQGIDDGALLAHANSCAHEALQAGQAGELLPHAARLEAISVAQWVTGLLQLQELPSDEAFGAYLKLRFPANWSGAAQTATAVLDQCEAVRSPTLRLLLLRSLLSSLDPAARTAASRQARELWKENAHRVAGYPAVAGDILAGLDVAALRVLSAEGNTGVSAGLVGPLLELREVDLALELAQTLSSAERLPSVARIALWCKLHAPRRWPQVRAIAEQLLRTPGQDTFELVTSPDVAELEFDVEYLVELAESYGSYHSVVALARLIQNVPSARTPHHLERLLALMAAEEDAAALGEVVACARWLAPAGAAALFAGHLRHGRMHESGLPQTLSGEAGIGPLAPLLVAVSDEAARAVVELLGDSPWLSAACRVSDGPA
jgi:hypothetical protein